MSTIKPRVFGSHWIPASDRVLIGLGIKPNLSSQGIGLYTYARVKNDALDLMNRLKASSYVLRRDDVELIKQAQFEDKLLALQEAELFEEGRVLAVSHRIVAEVREFEVCTLGVLHEKVHFTPWQP